MGYNSDGKSDFSWASYQQRGWDFPNVVAYMESHDEERVMYRALNFGDSSNGYDVRELETALLRSAMASTFLMSIPGPKMIWQFGELGYDVSIDDGGRLGQKPPKWDYLEDYARESLWNFYAEMIQLRKTHEVFSTADFGMDVSGALKRIALNGTEVDVRLVGNFGLEKGSKEAFFSRTGWWYNHFQGDSINVTNENMMISLRPGEFVLYTSEKLPGFRNVTSTGPDVFENANGTSVFPNPVENKIYIETLGNQQVSGVVVYDFSGRVVFEESAEGKNSYDLSSLATGLYLMEISTGKDSSSWHKIIKE
ncbi:T9SS type A sorting domain-containing protein [Marinilabilia salmonicolor]|nr:T9SS type A sorting domain-containing protein [Marinilabilia salmonicolor]